MKDNVGSGDCEFWWLVVSKYLRKAALIAAPFQKLSAICQTSLPRFLLNFCPWDVLGTWWRGLRCAPCPCWRVRWWYAFLSCQIVRCQATWHTLPCWCARQISLPKSKHRMNAKQQKTLTAAHGVSFRRSEIADLPRDRQSGEPQRSQKELRNCQPIKANAKLFSHILHGLLCIQPQRNAFKHLRLWTLIIKG